jgi:hypothetical protein
LARAFLGRQLNRYELSAQELDGLEDAIAL